MAYELTLIGPDRWARCESQDSPQSIRRRLNRAGYARHAGSGGCTTIELRRAALQPRTIRRELQTKLVGKVEQTLARHRLGGRLQLDDFGEPGIVLKRLDEEGVVRQAIVSW